MNSTAQKNLMVFSQNMYKEYKKIENFTLKVKPSRHCNLTPWGLKSVLQNCKINWKSYVANLNIKMFVYNKIIVLIAVKF